MGNKKEKGYRKKWDVKVREGKEGRVEIYKDDCKTEEPRRGNEGKGKA